MPSDDDLRAEVRRMADRIEVDTDQHLAAVLRRSYGAGRSAPSAVRRRRWLVPLAAAASVVAVVAVGVVLADVRPDRDVRPGIQKGVPGLLDGAPDGTVPSVYGHTRESATELLESKGLRVEYGEQIGCEPKGRPIATDPPTGTRVEPGDTVTVLLSYQGATTDCFADLTEPWALVDFAAGRGPAPRFADEVALFVDGKRAGALSGADAAAGDWGRVSALTILADASEQVLSTDDGYLTPYLTTITGTPPDSWCGVSRPHVVGDREALTITFAFEEPVPDPTCPARVAVYTTGDAIDTVVAWSEAATGDARQPIPDVVGLGLDEARDAVTAAGYSARVEEQETCHPRQGVVEQAPTQQALEDDAADEPRAYDGPVTLVVEVPHTSRDCAALDAAASTFLAFARGGPPPRWAPEVRQLLGYTVWDTVSSGRADERDAWSFCSGLGPDECQVSPLVVAARDVEVETDEYVDVARWPDEGCELIDRGGLPLDLNADHQIVLFPDELSSCDEDWSVWLWIDDEGRIEAVNLLVPQ